MERDEDEEEQRPSIPEQTFTCYWIALDFGVELVSHLSSHRKRHEE